jgi:uracil-DNA glycosylase family 4
LTAEAAEPIPTGMRKHPLAKCEECPLNGNRGKFVPSAGPVDVEIAFVGEAPGRQEAREGIPFIGPSGRLLTLVNNQFGINREEVFLTNACLCRPIDGSTPPKSAIQACRPRLLDELSGSGANTIIALGNSAALGVLGIEGVTKLRVGPGRRSPYPELAGRRILPTVHPAACLRQSDMFPSLVADIRKVVTEAAVWTEPEVEVVDEPEEAIRQLKRLEKRAGKLVVDIEVDIDKETSFDHPDRYGLLCVGLAYKENHALIIGEEACKSEAVLDALADCLIASKLVAQNGKFDLAGLFPHVGTLELDFDTMLANYAQDERPGIHGLKFQGVETLGAPQWDEEIKKYVGPRDGYGVIPRDLLYKYCGFDCACTYDLSEMHAERMDALRATEERTWPYYDRGLPVKGIRDVHDFLVEASNELMFVELNGIKVDRAYAQEAAKDYVGRIEKLKAEIEEVLFQSGCPTYGKKKGEYFNPASPQQVKQALGYFNVHVDSTNEDTLKLILDRLSTQLTYEDDDDPYRGLSQRQASLYKFIELMLVHRREAKMYSTYIKGVLKRMFRGRVYPTFMLHGTTTGRLSCRNPNLQNVPRESSIRKMFVPSKPENVFVQADYGQAELRVLTWLAQDEYFRAILNDPDRDLFDELTPILYPELPAKLEVPADLWKETRVRVKAFVYGLGYGRTEFSIAKEYKLPVKEAEKVKNRFFDTIPSIVDWQKWVKKEVWEGRDLITPFGRHRRFHLITEDNWKSIQNEAMAFLPQSTSSDICLRAMVRVRRDLRGSGAFVRNIVHDSILVDTPADAADSIGELLDRRMVESAQEVVGDYVAFRTDVKIGKHWGEV